MLKLILHLQSLSRPTLLSKQKRAGIVPAQAEVNVAM